VWTSTWAGSPSPVHLSLTPPTLRVDVINGWPILLNLHSCNAHVLVYMLLKKLNTVIDDWSSHRVINKMQIKIAILVKEEVKRIEAFEMWIWRRISCTERMKKY